MLVSDDHYSFEVKAFLCSQNSIQKCLDASFDSFKPFLTEACLAFELSKISEKGTPLMFA